MTFAEICIQDGKVTKAGELAERMLFERVTGKCAHEGERVCIKCGFYAPGRKLCFEFNPPLATSLDAWAEHIWPVMDKLTALKYIEELGVIASSCWSGCPNGMKCNWVDWNQQTAKPIHHLEAALRAYNLYAEWEARVK